MHATTNTKFGERLYVEVLLAKHEQAYDYLIKGVEMGRAAVCMWKKRNKYRVSVGKPVVKRQVTLKT